MSKNKILILVEGQTEQGFVKHVLANHFGNVVITPTINTTKFVKSGPDFKGGVTHYNQVKKEILRLLNDTSAAAVTTMFDYYGLPDDFPKFNEQTGDCYQRVEFLEQALKDDIDNTRFIPYLQLHEFEALLFSAPGAIDETMVGSHPSNSRLQQIRGDFRSPEEINNNPTTCPSNRILGVYPEYEKVIHGQIISRNIGVQTMTIECRHFSEWVEKIRTVLEQTPAQENTLF